jgi:molybdopterin-guanine dinucleotide biosynthesis protein B
MTLKIVTIIGKSGSGKTTLMEKLIVELKERGYRIGTLKHHSHSGFDIDKPGKDSWRHAQAGSDHVIIAAPDKIASYRLIQQEMEFDEILKEFKELDLILVEGYKSANQQSIEVLRKENGTELISEPHLRIAVASDMNLELDVPVVGLDDVSTLADLIEQDILEV